MACPVLVPLRGAQNRGIGAEEVVLIPQMATLSLAVQVCRSEEFRDEMSQAGGFGDLCVHCHHTRAGAGLRPGLGPWTFGLKILDWLTESYQFPGS
jgi:hypothetical protein